MAFDSCKRCCTNLTRNTALLFLFILNIIDLAAGLLIFAYALYLLINKYAPDYVYGSLLYLGVLLIVVSSISWLAAADCWLTFFSVSAWLGLVLAVSELIVGIIFISQDSALEDFLHNHQEELQISDDTLNKIVEYQVYIGAVLLGLTVLEVLRFFVSRKLKVHIREVRKVEKQKVKLTSAEKKRAEKEAEQAIHDKYAKLREDHRKKYGLDEV